MPDTLYEEYGFRPVPTPGNNHAPNKSWIDLVTDGAARIVAELSKLTIVSSAKCFKTWLSIYLALAIAHGRQFLNRATARRKVLYVNLELKDSTFERRVQAIAKALGIEIEKAWFFHLPLRGKMAGLSVHQVLDRIIEACRHFEAQVVVLDPVFKLNIEGEENSSRDQTRFFNELDRLTTEPNCTVILNDHSGKGNQSEKDPLDVIRGSSAKGGDLDAAMVLRKHESDDCFRVDMVHRELPPVAPFTIGWHYPLMELRDLDPDAMKKAGRGREHNPLKLLSAIRHTTKDCPISISAWAEAARINRNTLTGYLTEMRVKGWYSTAGDGNTARQFITENGLNALREAGV